MRIYNILPIYKFSLGHALLGSKTVAQPVVERHQGSISTSLRRTPRTLCYESIMMLLSGLKHIERKDKGSRIEMHLK